ncbi:RcnB family protein [Brevundimonas goettingensis]|uniref:RcnB family protein n=1 Tax=Brevundimonas goettingensis TaxID=2774190 RepID=A0A975C5D2_9CAUL|nr:RcnB family protein [Brevundimonas goettingensis]QTC91867.1 RcnB family protein [Brevundimonas goettingensis]
MNKTVITAALAAVIASASFGVASAAPAPAQHRAPAHAQPAHPQPPAVRPAPAPQAYGRWQQAPRRYSAPRYVAPRGSQARAWSYGQRMPAQYRTRTYVVTDYGHYGLRAPPRGYQYVRSGNDVVLTAVATGLITAVIAGLFN